MAGTYGFYVTPVPTSMPAALANTLSITPAPTYHVVSILDKKRNYSVCGLVDNFPVSFGDLTIFSAFIAVARSPYHILGVLPEMEMSLAWLDLGK